MAQWLFEQGIGEDRAVLVDGEEILEAAIELPGTLRAGTVADARLTAILVPRKRGIVAFGNGREALVEPLPPTATQGGLLRVEIVREAIAESGREKLAKAKATDAPTRAGASLRERIGEAREVPTIGDDLFEQAGWSELLEEARTGEISFPGGALRMSLTPAMTLFDVDGALEPAALAVAGAAAAGRAIRRFGIGGSIGVDLPTIAAKGDRLAAAEALDRALPQPFERTAVNGFGFLQVVRRRERASLPETLRIDPTGAAARALLRRAGRTAGGGAMTLVAAPAVVVRLERETAWLAALARATGGPVALQPQDNLPIFGGYAHHRQS
jgi:hypothetical protein